MQHILWMSFMHIHQTHQRSYLSCTCCRKAVGIIPNANINKNLIFKEWSSFVSLTVLSIYFCPKVRKCTSTSKKSSIYLQCRNSQQSLSIRLLPIQRSWKIPLSPFSPPDKIDDEKPNEEMLLVCQLYINIFRSVNVAQDIPSIWPPVFVHEVFNICE